LSGKLRNDRYRTADVWGRSNLLDAVVIVVDFAFQFFDTCRKIVNFFDRGAVLAFDAGDGKL